MMSGGVEIKNTIKFSFENGSEKPSMGEIVRFVKALDADPVQMEATYRIAEEKSLFIKFKSEEPMRHTLLHNPEQIAFHYDSGKVVDVRMSNAGDFIQYVRVYDLPPEVPDRDLALVLGKYGLVKRVVREKFPAESSFDMYTGVRGVYMDVKKEIPTSLHFLNRKGNVFYQGNKNVCFLCKIEGHRMNSCPKRKPRKQVDKQLLDEERKGENEKDEYENRSVSSLNTSSYADVAAGGATAEVIEVLDEEVMAIDEMTHEIEPIEKEETGSQGQKHVFFSITVKTRTIYEQRKYSIRSKIMNRRKKKVAGARD